MSKEKIIESILDVQSHQVIDDFALKGYSVIDQFLSPTEVDRLYQYIVDLKNQEQLKKAAIGNQNTESIQKDIRGDYIQWINFNENSLFQVAVQNKIQYFIQNLNRQLYLGIKDYEFHTTVYPEGTRYAKHFDRFKNNSSRVVSMVMYLNKEWKTGDGGELKIFQNGKKDLYIEPLAGRLVTFLSDEIEHEVVETKYERYSITGWLLDQPKELNFIRNH